VLDVLTGKASDKMTGNGHTSLSVFGIGTEYTTTQWRSILRQLLVLGFLKVDTAGYGGIQLTEKSRPLLRGDIELPLRRDLLVSQKSHKPKASKAPISAADSDLFDALRACRKDLASEHGVPPYVIFHDTTLAHMATVKPQTKTEMLAVSGVGETKLDRFGAEFLNVIETYITNQQQGSSA